MNNIDIAIILKSRSLANDGQISTFFSEKFGLCQAFIKSQEGYYQIASLIEYTHLPITNIRTAINVIHVHNLKSYYQYIFNHDLSNYALSSLTELLTSLIRRNEPNEILFKQLLLYFENLANGFSFVNYLHIELAILNASGYSVDLHRCSVTGSEENLKYVSPKTGTAICAAIGDEYEDKLIKLPQFMLSGEEPKNKEELKAGLYLNSYFFRRYIYLDLFSRNLFIGMLLDYPMS